MRTTFARFGIPETVVTDNGPCFASKKFEGFMEWRPISRWAPYHPSSNGLAEHAVQIFLRKMKQGTLEDKLARFCSNIG